MRLVDHEQEVVGEIVDQRRGGAARRPAVDVSRVVLDARAEADLPHHFEVVAGAHAQALRLEEFALALEVGETRFELFLDARHRLLHALRSRDIVRRGEDAQRVDLPDHVAGQRMQVVERLDLVTEELDPHRQLFVRRDDLDGVAADTKAAAGERHVITRVLHVDQQPEQCVAVDLVADLHLDGTVEVGLRSAEAVDARHRCHDHHVAS